MSGLLVRPMIDSAYVDSTCKPGQGEACCAFLLAGPGGMECAKGTGYEKIIKERLKAGTFTAKGDNCVGWHIVRLAGETE